MIYYYDYKKVSEELESVFGRLDDDATTNQF